MPSPDAVPPGTLALVVRGLPANTGAVEVARVEGPNGYRQTVEAGPGQPVYLDHLEPGAYAVHWEALEAADQRGRGVFVPTPSGQTVLVGGGSGAPAPIAQVTYSLGTGLVALVPDGLPSGAEPLSLGTLHGPNGGELAVRGYPGTPTVSRPLRPGAYVMEWANVIVEVNGDTLLFEPTPRGHEISLGASFVPLRVATRYQLASGVVELSARGLPPNDGGAEYVGTLTGPRGAVVEV